MSARVVYTCDGCGRRYATHTNQPTLAAIEAREHGWSIGTDEDQCPPCEPDEVWVKGGTSHARTPAP